MPEDSGSEFFAARRGGSGGEAGSTARFHAGQTTPGQLWVDAWVARIRRVGPCDFNQADAP
jgi:hypothetical protein